MGRRVRREHGALRIAGDGVAGRAVNRFLAERGLFADVLQPMQQTLEEVFFELTDRDGSDD